VHQTVNNPLTILKQTYGYGQFRGQQAEIIDYVNRGGSAFVLMPTGSGKSLCYQIPSLCRDGVGVIISPLIALMQDQITALEQLGISAGAINSGMPYGEVLRVRQKLENNQLDLLYVAPERLVMEEFLALLDQVNIALFAIDEAHCVSQWGHDFRPDYTALSLLANRFKEIPRIALTATADQATRKDIVDRLKLREGKTFVAGLTGPIFTTPFWNEIIRKNRFMILSKTITRGTAGSYTVFHEKSGRYGGVVTGKEYQCPALSCRSDSQISKEPKSGPFPT